MLNLKAPRKTKHLLCFLVSVPSYILQNISHEEKGPHRCMLLLRIVNKNILQGENPHTPGQTDLQRTFFKTIHPSSSQQQLFSMALLNVKFSRLYEYHTCLHAICRNSWPAKTLYVDILLTRTCIDESKLTYMQYTNICGMNKFEKYMQYTNVCAINKFIMQWQHKRGQDFSYNMKNYFALKQSHFFKLNLMCQGLNCIGIIVAI